jgi:hypothetical protein
MPQSVLIIGEDPGLIDFSAPGAPPGMDADKVLRGLNGSRDRLEHAGHDALSSYPEVWNSPQVCLAEDKRSIQALTA